MGHKMNQTRKESSPITLTVTESKRIQCTKVADKCCTNYETALHLSSIQLRALGTLDSHNFECVTNDTKAPQGTAVTLPGSLRTTIP